MSNVGGATSKHENRPRTMNKVNTGADKQNIGCARKSQYKKRRCKRWNQRVHRKIMGLGSLFFCLLQKTPKGFLSSFTQHGRLPTKHQRTLSQMQTVATATARTTFVTRVPINVVGHHRRRRQCCSGIILLLYRGMRETQQSHRRKPSPTISIVVRASTGITQTSHSSRWIRACNHATTPCRCGASLFEALIHRQRCWCRRLFSPLSFCFSSPLCWFIRYSGNVGAMANVGGTRWWMGWLLEGVRMVKNNSDGGRWWRYIRVLCVKGGGERKWLWSGLLCRKKKWRTKKLSGNGLGSNYEGIVGHCFCELAVKNENVPPGAPEGCWWWGF